jgi:hypothetical protein
MNLADVLYGTIRAMVYYSAFVNKHADTVTVIPRFNAIGAIS